MTIDEKLDKILDLLIAMSAVLKALDLPSAPKRPSGPPTTLPGYGRSANQPIAGASLDDLRWYATNCQKSLEDPGKAKWHEKEKAMKAALEEEIARQTRPSKPADVTEYQPPPDDDSLPF